ncbi:unnamed protein product [Amoebophrya sp. A120]|nr:unnamed protein product [Amoebophrya sp. A120]
MLFVFRCAAGGWIFICYRQSQVRAFVVPFGSCCTCMDEVLDEPGTENVRSSTST